MSSSERTVPPSSAQRGTGWRKWWANTVCVISCGNTLASRRSSGPWISIFMLEDLALAELERRRPARPFHVDRHVERTRLRPGRHLVAEPLQRLLPAIVLGVLADLLGDLGRRGVDEEVGGLILGPERAERRAEDQENGRSSHAESLQETWEEHETGASRCGERASLQANLEPGQNFSVRLRRPGVLKCVGHGDSGS